MKNVLFIISNCCRVNVIIQEKKRKERKGYSQSQSIYIYIRQPEPIVARPTYKNTHCPHTTQHKYYYTDKREKRETTPLLKRDICCRKSHLHFKTISSKCGEAFIAQVVLSKRSGMDHTVLSANYTVPSLLSIKAFTRWHHSRLKQRASNGNLLLIYRHLTDERLSWLNIFTIFI